MKKLFLFSVSLFFICHTSFSQVQTQALDSLFNTLSEHNLALGNLTISKGDKVVYEHAVGYSFISPTDKTLATSQTKYRIGSVSKMFTSVMIFQLVDERKLSLDQKLDTYFPTVPNADKITIAHMLSHRSGLHDYTNGTDFENWMNKAKPQEELIGLIVEKGSDFDPGSKADYSNSNYLLLSYILEKITGKTYESNLQTRITSKVGLKNTSLAKVINPKKDEATSYKYGNNIWNPVIETESTIHSGAGALVSTTGDLTIFIHALFNGKLLKKSSFEKMITITEDYGMGIFPYNHGTTQGYGHNGRIEEFYTAVRYFPASGISLAYCTNGINFPRINILEEIISSSFGEKINIPFSNTNFSLNAYPGTYAAQNMPNVDISIQGEKLVAETQGAKFELEAISPNYFMHAPTGYYFEFNPSGSSLQIKETDNVYFLKKK